MRTKKWRKKKSYLPKMKSRIQEQEMFPWAYLSWRRILSNSPIIFTKSVSCRALGWSENPGVSVLIGGHNLPKLVEIGLTDRPKSGGAPWPRGRQAWIDKVPSFSKQFARYWLDTNWRYFKLRLAWTSAEITAKLCQVKIMQNTLLKINELLSKSTYQRQRLRGRRVATDIWDQRDSVRFPDS